MTYRRVINRKRLPNRVSKNFHTKHASTFKRLESFPKHNTHMGAQPGELGSLALSKLKFLIYYDLSGQSGERERWGVLRKTKLSTFHPLYSRGGGFREGWRKNLTTRHESNLNDN